MTTSAAIFSEWRRAYPPFDWAHTGPWDVSIWSMLEWDARHAEPGIVRPSKSLRARDVHGAPTADVIKWTEPRHA